MTDAHNHLQQLTNPVKALAQAKAQGLNRMLVNGTCEQDWPQVAILAQAHPEVIPSYGLHPWHIAERSTNWLTTLREHLSHDSQATIGECGLDRWKKPFDLDDQILCLEEQIDLANEFQRPLTIHCLQAWGPLLELLLRQTSLTPFLLHAYSGSAEMIPAFIELGAYFSFNGYFLHERKANVREVFRHIPKHRLLLETDAPAMLPPSNYQSITLPDEQNHPANLSAFLKPLAKLRQAEPRALSQQLETNLDSFLSLKSSR